MATTLSLAPSLQNMNQIAGTDDYSVYSYNVTGSPQTEQIFDATYGSFTGDTYVTGWVPESDSSPYLDVFVARYNASGVQVWNRTWGVSNEDDVGYGIVYDANGKIWVTGSSGGIFGDLILLKYDSAGTLLLSKLVHPSSGGLVGNDICADNVWISGQPTYIYVTGYMSTTVQNKSIILFKFRADNGNQVWNRTYNYQSNRDIGNTVIATYDKSFTVVTVGGYVTDGSTGDKNAILLRYDRNGNRLWTKIWGDTDTDESVEDLDYPNYFDSTYLYGCGYDADSSGDVATIWRFDNATGAISANYQYSHSGSRFYSIDVTTQLINSVVTPFAYATGEAYVSSQKDLLFMSVNEGSHTIEVESVTDFGSNHDDVGYGVAVGQPSAAEVRYVLTAGLVDYASVAPKQQILTVFWSQDYDGDGLSNMAEYFHGTQYDDTDTDNDGMNDYWEVTYGLDPLSDDAQSDLDGDGVLNIYEYGNGTLPNNSDTDGDSMDDYWEIVYSLDPTNATDALDDPDGDSLINKFEYGNGTLPNNNDTDSDGMDDYWELFYALNPLSDSDARSDLDHDGLLNIYEYGNGTLPNNNDTDNDGMNDYWEILYGLDPLNSADALGDIDSDGVLNVYEYRNGTLPNNNDTDGDGMDDYWEISYGLNPLVDDASGDADNDGISNLAEYQAGTDPTHDQVPPVISSVTRDPATVVTSSDSVTIYVDASDHNGISQVLIMSNYTGSLLNYSATFNASLNLYQFTIPAQNAGVVVTYRVFVEDNGGNWVSSTTSSYHVVESRTTTSTTGTSSTSTTTAPGGVTDFLQLPPELMLIIGGSIAGLIIVGIIVKTKRSS